MSQEAFTYMIWIVVVLGSLAAVITLATSGKNYEQIGKGGLFNDEDGPRASPHAAIASSGAERDAEIRQLLEARNLRRARRGEQPQDVETELAALTRPAIDAGLLGEIRDLIEARNARRIRQGREPLDVEAEVARRLDDLT
jgi:hypothetical protein